MYWINSNGDFDGDVYYLVLHHLLIASPDAIAAIPPLAMQMQGGPAGEGEGPSGGAASLEQRRMRGGRLRVKKGEEGGKKAAKCPLSPDMDILELNAQWSLYNSSSDFMPIGKADKLREQILAHGPEKLRRGWRGGFKGVPG
jgi:hypothetical protein